jgi:hypothetical protein
MQWDNDRNFMRATCLLYRDDYDLATAWRQTKGRTAARARMQHRYEGWRLLTSLAALAESADLARKQIAAATERR